jgi:hypothetical protein
VSIFDQDRPDQPSNRRHLMTVHHGHSWTDRRIVTRNQEGEGFLWILHPDGRITPEDPSDPRLGGDGVPRLREDLRLS